MSTLQFSKLIHEVDNFLWLGVVIMSLLMLGPLLVSIGSNVLRTSQEYEHPASSYHASVHP